MAEPETDATDISLRAAEVAADISETDQPRERRRLVSAFTRAAASGARAAGRGTRAVRRGAGSGTGWLAGQVVAMAPRLRVRDQAALQAQFPGQSADEIADALIDHAAHAAAAAGGAAGVAAALPVLPAFPAEIAAETLVMVGIELKLVAELHEAYGTPAPGNFAERMSAYLAAWAHRGAASGAMAVPVPRGPASRRLRRPRFENQAGRGGVRVQDPVGSGDLAGRGDHAPPGAHHLPGGDHARRVQGQRLDDVHLQLERGVRLAAVGRGVHGAAHGRVEQGAEDAAVH